MNQPVPDNHAVVRVHDRIADIDSASWDACAGPDDPFVSHAFLLALEETGCATADTGWVPRHLLVEGDGEVVGAAPVYLKGHSYGEFVFDWSWAAAYERAGQSYYPKLQCCVPFSPVTGPRLMVRPGADRTRTERLLLAAMVDLCRRHELSSAHVTFLDEPSWRLGGEVGLLQRQGSQYHWPNRGYGSYDEFLASLVSRKRKALKRERRRAAEVGARIRVLSGGDLHPEHWQAFYPLYLSTIDRKWARPYLTRELFHRLGEVLADRVALVVAEDGGQMVAAALNLIGARALYGRYWGCRPGYGDLHFEMCYHRAIELAIELGLERVEAGAQGEHKIQRGYLPVATYSLHHLADPGFATAVRAYLERERAAIAKERDVLSTSSPYRSLDRDP